MKKSYIWISLLVILIIGGVFSYSRFTHRPSIAITPTQAVSSTFSYKGEDGKDAFTLLQAKTPIELSSSGLVISINGRKADDSKHEYWAFSVNGKMAAVGPKDYQTKSTDMIEWRIATY